jgi:hypothetical protein
MTLSDNESSDEDVGQANNMYYGPIFAGACSSNEPHLLAQGGSVTNTVKDDFTKTLWLWKSGTKVSEPQVCWQTIPGQ